MNDRRGQPPTRGERRSVFLQVVRERLLHVAIMLAAVIAVLLFRRQWGPVSVAQACAALGLALDILCVWLLARGALISDEAISQIGTYDDLEGTARRPAAIRLRVEGRAGVFLAILGFGLQFIAGLLPGSWTLP